MRGNTTDLNKRRIDWIDIAKAVGMLLVIIGHSSKSLNWFNSYIYSFHMAFFFLLSGLTFNPDKVTKFSNLVKKKAKSILIPYLWFSLLGLGLRYLVCTINGETYDFVVLLKGILYSNSSEYRMPTGALWFLTALFLTEIVFWALYKFFKKDIRILSLAVGALSILGYAESRGKYMDAPWHINSVPVILLFFFLGFLFGRNYDRIKHYFDNWKTCIPIAAIAFVVGACACYFNVRGKEHRISLHAGVYHSFVLFLISACATILFFLIVSMKLPKLRLLTYIGQNTLIYLCLHLYIVEAAKALIPWAFTRLAHQIAFSVVLFFILLIPTVIINKLLPFMVNKKYSFRKTVKST